MSYKIVTLKWKKNLHGCYSGHLPCGQRVRYVFKSHLKSSPGYSYDCIRYPTLLEAIAAAQKSFEDYVMKNLEKCDED